MRFTYSGPFDSALVFERVGNVIRLMACHERGTECNEGPSRMAPEVGLELSCKLITNNLQYMSVTNQA